MIKSDNSIIQINISVNNMSNKEILLKEYIKNSKQALILLHDQGFLFLDDDFIWKILIYELEAWDIPTEVLYHNLSTQDIISLIKKYFDKNGLPIETIKLEQNIVPIQSSDELIKARIKFKGDTLVIHKGDKDPFPSNPHAHNYEDNYKLHLGNGRLFRKANNVGKINKKELIALRKIIIQRIPDIVLPALEE
jgi:hypothetical protein